MPLPMPHPNTGTQPAKPSAAALAAVICGILAVLFAFVPVASGIIAIPLALAALICGAVAYASRKQPRSRAIFGMITGGSALLLAITMTVVYGVAFGGAASSNEAKPAFSVPPSEVSSPVETPEPVPTTPAEPPAEAPPAPAPPAAPTNGYGTYPAEQAAFVATIDDAVTQLDAAQTDLQRNQIIQARDAALCAATTNKAVNWVGKIIDVGANGDGYAYVRIEISPNVVIQTWNNAFSDGSDATLIRPEEAPFPNLVAMNNDTLVTFSGTFLGSDESCLKRANITEAFYGIDPNFIMKFSDIRSQ